MNEIERANLLLRIEGKLQEIETVLDSYPYEKSDNLAFFSGTGGLALYYYQKFTQTSNSEFLSKSIEVFDLGLKKLLKQEILYTGFTEGISGYLWFYFRYSFDKHYTISDTILNTLKEILKAQFKHNLNNNDWDYMLEIPVKLTTLNRFNLTTCTGAN